MAKRQNRLLTTDEVRRLVTEALIEGTLKREPCLVCGSPGNTHHWDYTKPLDVVWYCKSHHSKLHYNLYLGKIEVGVEHDKKVVEQREQETRMYIW